MIMGKNVIEKMLKVVNSFGLLSYTMLYTSEQNSGIERQNRPIMGMLEA